MARCPLTYMTASTILGMTARPLAGFETAPCKTWYQEGLKEQQSRMDVDLPFASRLGVETADNDKDKKVHACDTPSLAPVSHANS